MFAVNSEDLNHTFDFVPYEPGSAVMVSNRIIIVDGICYAYGVSVYYVTTIQHWSIDGWVMGEDGSKAPDSVKRAILQEFEMWFILSEDVQDAYLAECKATGVGSPYTDAYEAALGY